MKLIDLLKEYDEQVYEEVRFEIYNNPFSKEELSIEEQDLFIESLRETNDDIHEAIESIQFYRNMDERQQTIYTYIGYHFDKYTSLQMVINREYGVYESAEEYVENYFWNTTGDLDKTLNDTFGSYVGSRIFWSIDMNKLGEDMIRDSENLYFIGDGEVLEIRL